MSVSPGAVLRAPLPGFPAAEAERIAAERFGVRGEVRRLGSERDQNFLVLPQDGGAFVLKLANAAEDPEVIAFQAAALRYVAARDPQLPVPGVKAGLGGTDTEIVEGPSGERHAVWMLEFLEGEPMPSAPASALRRDMGSCLARLGRALRGFFHRGAGRQLLWDLRHVPRLRDYLPHVEDGQRRRLAELFLDRFEARAAPVLPGLRAQVIHNDFHEGNLLVDPQASSIVGILDFGDMVHSALINDVAVATAYQMHGAAEPLEPACEVLAAYHAVTPLEEQELGVLLDLVAGRMLLSGVVAAWRLERVPGSREHVLGHDESAWRTLERLATIDPEAAEERFRAACGLDTIPAVAPPADIENMLQRRTRLLGPALGLFYERPLHIVRGEGAWLYDAEDRAYLDVYNNVAHVGHCHPRVVEALSRQAATLNTNTRYLHEAILELAERITATMPAELDTCMFVCSGSEAVDLAWRLAKAHTGNAGGIVIEGAYHGMTDAVVQLSPDELPPEARGDHVAQVAAPDGYRGPFRRGEADIGARYAALLDGAIDALAARGHRPAAFILDTILASSGIRVAPHGYLEAAAGRVRRAGGVFIADEVQAGFGRLGEHTWGFEFGRVIPDIVTLGKPMGNGHPIAAVVARREIAESFAARMSYFNTFAGNPVSCAAGLAVLDVLEQEELQQRAATIGAELRAGLEDLASRHPLIGDVRGAGLFLGAELVRDRDTREPATEEAGRIMNAMRDRGVLIGRAGRDRNVLKLRPPLVFAREHAELLLETLDGALAAEAG